MLRRCCEQNPYLRGHSGGWRRWQRSPLQFASSSSRWAATLDQQGHSPRWGFGGTGLGKGAGDARWEGGGTGLPCSLRSKSLALAWSSGVGLGSGGRGPLEHKPSLRVVRSGLSQAGLGGTAPIGQDSICNSWGLRHLHVKGMWRWPRSVPHERIRWSAVTDQPWALRGSVLRGVLYSPRPLGYFLWAPQTSAFTCLVGKGWGSLLGVCNWPGLGLACITSAHVLSAARAHTASHIALQDWLGNGAWLVLRKKMWHTCGERQGSVSSLGRKAANFYRKPNKLINTDWLLFHEHPATLTRYYIHFYPYL